MTDIITTTFEGEVKTPIIAGVEITADKHGRFNLNALHKASGEGDHKAPNKWLRLEATKALIAELRDQTPDLAFAPVHTSHGGKTPGTFANELLAVDYAGWINPAFRLEVHQTFIDCRTGRSAPALPPEVLDQIERSFGITRMLAHKVTGIEATVQTLATAISAIAEIVRPAAPGTFVQGVTAGEIWARYGLPRLKNAPSWLGNRLVENGCQLEGCRRGRLGSRSARMFDPDKSAACMRNGLVDKAKAYATQRTGQRRFNLIGGGK